MKIFQVDAFTKCPFFGNPAAVCMLEEDVAYQASSRGGVVRIKVAESRVLLSGQAVTVMKGELL